MSNNIKDNVQSGEVFSLNSEAHESAGFGFHGHTKISVTRATGESEVIKDDHNLIIGGAAQNGTLATPTGLKSYFAHSMSSDATLGALIAADLFEADSADQGEWSPGSNISTWRTAEGTDGIILSASGSLTEGIFAMLTTEMTAANTYGRKWKGTFTADVPGQFSAAAIGSGILATLGAGATITTDVFAVPYATQSFTTQVLGVGDTLTIEWEIYIA
jgi:hypothetical protein